MDLAVPEGDLAAILGPSGAGKTTLLRILAFLDAPTEGDLFYCGRLVSGRREEERAELRLSAVAYVPPVLPGLPAEAHQRDAIHRALAGGPPLLLVDEPTGRLDSAAGGRILALLSGLHQSGLGLLLATDDPEVAACCLTVYRMRDGMLRRLSG